MKKFCAKFLMVFVLAAVMVVPSSGFAADIALWLDGYTTDGGNGIATAIRTVYGVGSYDLVTTAQLETVGFLNSYKSVVVSRYDASFGTSMSQLAANNIAAYVGARGPAQGAVAIFTNDAADNLLNAGVGDPFDPNINQLFFNALGFALASGHGYIGEFNGAVMAMDSNSAGWAHMGLLQGNASGTYGVGPMQFVYDVGPIGSGHPIDAGVTFPFTDADVTTFRTDITGYDPNTVVDIYRDNGLPAVLANAAAIHGVPEPSMMFLFGVALAGLGVFRKKF
jgi:hypothetical protein